VRRSGEPDRLPVTIRLLEAHQVTAPLNPAPGVEPPPVLPPDPRPEEGLEPAPFDPGSRGPVQILKPEVEEVPPPVEVVLLGEATEPPRPHQEPGPTSVAIAAAAATGVDGEVTAAAAMITAGEAFAAKSARAEASAERLIAELGKRLGAGMKDDAQKEAAALIALISDLAYEEFTEFFPLAKVAVDAVTATPPNLTLAARIRKDIRLRTNLLLRPVLFLRTGHPAVQVILGLSTNLYLAIPIALLLLPQAVSGSLFPGTHDHTFVLVGVAGAVGSIVSMLVRIQDFDNEQAEHRAILFFTGFFKPVIGIASALFMVIVLEAGLIPLGIEDADRRVFFFLALAFVAGFSERLASDIVSRTEGKVLGGVQQDPRTQGMMGRG